MDRRAIVWGRLALAVTAVCWFVAGLALSRLLFEGLFPAGALMGWPVGALGLGMVLGGLGVGAAAKGARRLARNPVVLAVAFLPLLINPAWLFDATVNPARGRFLFGAGLWLVAVLLVWTALGDRDRRWAWLGPLLVGVALLPVYLATMSHAVGAADSFEFQVVAPQLGIAHPTGYPLYLLLGKAFSLLPAGTQAWRLNLASAVYAAAAAMVVFRLGLEIFRRPLAALAGAVALGLVPIYWGQAIIAEVYTLHALVVAVALWLMVRVGRTTNDELRVTSDELRVTNDELRVTSDGRRSRDRSRVVARQEPRPLPVGGRPTPQDRKTMVGLAFVLGLGLTNHLTTVFLLPAAALAVLFNLWPIIGYRTSRRRSLIPLFFQLLIAFAVPLLLYAYLPLRWAAVNGEPMGLGRFVEWVAGGRFQGALQWGAWLHDPARRAIVGRLLLDAWGWFYPAVAAVGLVWLFARHWRVALMLLVTAAGFTFYALNYYVPDLAVFLIPVHVVVAVWVGAGVAGVAGVWRREEGEKGGGGESADFADYADLRGETEFFGKNSVSILASIVFIIALLPAVLGAGGRWGSVDQSGRDGGEPWARLALTQPPARGAAILADSEKIAPLYYLQQAEGLRPDLDIMVLPDEAAYRAELDARLAAGQAVYLARYLPGLAGIYHLRSAGPLVEVSREPLTELPDGVVGNGQTLGPLHLLGHQVSAAAGEARLTLYWTLARPLGEGEETPVVYLRWADERPPTADGRPTQEGSGPSDGGRRSAVGGLSVGVHPAGDTYPVNAWRPGEIVPDFHTLPLPDAGCGTAGCALVIEAAVAPRFTPAAELEWQPVATLTSATLAAPRRSGPVGAARRALFDGFALDGIEFPAAARPGAALPLRYSGFGDGEGLRFALVPAHAASSLVFPVGRGTASRPEGGESWAWAAAIEPATEAGPHALVAWTTGEAGATCGWLSPVMTGCVVAEIEISGAALPEGATNFDDKIALVGATVDAERLVPGGQLPVTLTWQGLAEMGEDYTVFVQVLDAADRIVGQADAWPVQGTFPTSQWRPGQVVTDPHLVQLSADMGPGEHRVIVGLYLLATGQRLPVVDGVGDAVDDKVEIRLISD